METNGWRFYQMQYVLHDTTAYGIYNGISGSAVEDFIFETAKELGLNILDYDNRSILREINHDAKLKAMAQEIYRPYPIQDGWTDEYKTIRQKAIEDRTAPGVAEIPDVIVYQMIREILTKLADKLLPKRRAEEAAAAKERKDIMRNIDNIITGKYAIEDEGGKTTQYIHTVTMKNGETFQFSDRNVFDFGRVINPLYPISEDIKSGGLCLMRNGKPYWMDAKQGQGLVPVRPLLENEKNAFNAVAKYCGHCNSGIRM